MVKAWIELITCCLTRAAHLDLIENLTPSAFINCLAFVQEEVTRH